ncbi:hypothetical protein [Klebsiella michiganensis]|nr:hypothetical protein [Klebsiella michiganensis]
MQNTIKAKSTEQNTGDKKSTSFTVNVKKKTNNDQRRALGALVK